MKRQPFDSLTPQDKYNIRKYIELYGKAECGPLDIVLDSWNKSKKRLYHAFGNQLRVKKEINIVRTEYMVESDLKHIYRPIILNSNNLRWYANDLYSAKPDEDDFVFDFLIFISKNPYLMADEKMELSHIFCYINIVKGCITNIEYLKLNQYNFTCKRGMKTIRTVQKCLKALDYPNMEKFYRWRDKVNLVDKTINKTVNLVFSIHPIDFMTMSDNNCNWTSCMSWINSGCYHAGTMEMMNSNVAIVAYIEADTPFKISLDEFSEIKLSNKIWRQLAYVSKDFILTGKAYPYQDKDISIEILTFIRELVAKFGWKYRYINQEYKDLKRVHKNYFVKYVADPRRYNKHKVFTYVNGMYNDMVEDHDTTYWCCRNKTELRLNLSGPVTCVCCGKPIYENVDIYEPAHIETEKICDDCLNHRKCDGCGKVVYNLPYNYRSVNFCSRECAEDSLCSSYKGQEIIISKEDFLSNSDKAVFIVGRNEKITNFLIKEFENNNSSDIQRVSDVRKMLYEITDNLYIEGRDYFIKVVSLRFFQKMKMKQHGYIEYIFSRLNFYLYISSYVVRKTIWHNFYRDSIEKIELNDAADFLNILVNEKPTSVLSLIEREKRLEVENENSNSLIH